LLGIRPYVMMQNVVIANPSAGRGDTITTVITREREKRENREREREGRVNAICGACTAQREDQTRGGVPLVVAEHGIRARVDADLVGRLYALAGVGDGACGVELERVRAVGLGVGHHHARRRVVALGRVERGRAAVGQQRPDPHPLEEGRASSDRFIAHAPARQAVYRERERESVRDESSVADRT
jgi:hypothetical protein